MTGFDFSNHNRNHVLHAKGVPLPKATSTGTTIVGCTYDNGVVVRYWPSLHQKAAFYVFSLKMAPQTNDYDQIAADTRATSGEIVADKVYSNPRTFLPKTIPAN